MTVDIRPEEGYRTRAARLEDVLGPGDDPANPLGHRAVLAADERGVLLADGERALHDFGLNAEFVPAHLGGRFERADRLGQLMRAVFRRDCALGIGYGVTSFIAGLPVWADGTPEQQARVARTLLAGGRVVAAYTELAHGSDFSRTEFTAAPGPDGFVLDGGKQLVNNISRAELAVFFARTAEGPGSRGHSHLLVDLTALPAGRVRRDKRYPVSGVRGCLLGGIEIDECVVPPEALLGAEGGAMETVLRVFQVTRAVLPSMVVGVGDTQLRTVLGFARDRRLYGRSLADLPSARTTLAGCFADLLVCDAFASVVGRSLHLRPGETSVSAAAVKYLVPKLLQESSYRLSVQMGARSYLRTGSYAMFQKAARDLPVVALAHAGSAVCQASLVTQLPRLAERGWRSALAAQSPEHDDAGSVYDLDGPLPPLRLGALELNARGADSLAGDLVRMHPVLVGRAGREPALGLLAGLTGLFVTELRGLADRVLALAPRDRTVLAGPRAFTLADRYAHVLAAAAVAAVWWHSYSIGAGTPSADPVWAGAALHRLAARLGLRPGPLPPDIEDRLFADLTARHEAARTFDLFQGHLASGPARRPGS
ncbi:alkylation response protein AidB-like acyl-CoA dehydrogenase [Micromonospora sp. A202]|uniref:acyl-CoA dehydrogenase family protein n=1 Tax=Micromonospora sp. A202 TaxID=2572899 RepID=UPI00115393FF|nr:acyl-CoA dehydrogenase family protein [Micromonospora sp. A202]TQJ23656.1 alkylation response protein AidB-like acyl-CoA dehydrogenase [Micromonospora sp. A202]